MSEVMPSDPFSVIVAIDPWILDFDGTGEDDDLRIEALQKLKRFLEEANGPLELLPFIDAEFWGRDRMNPPPWQALGPYLASLCCSDERSDAARDQLSTSFPPGAPRRWLVEVDTAVKDDTSPRWRDPIFLFPLARQTAWPNSREIQIPDKAVQRVVALLEDPHSNTLFTTDLNPWCCERLRGTAKDDEVRTTRDLPKPAAVQSRRMEEWPTRLSSHDDSGALKGERLDYVPPEEWSPCTIPKADWRECPFGTFGKKLVPGHGQKKGPKDRRGRIWAWDDAHHTHWDVQHQDAADQRYLNVRLDGIITKGYDD